MIFIIRYFQLLIPGPWRGVCRMCGAHTIYTIFQNKATRNFCTRSPRPSLWLIKDTHSCQNNYGLVNDRVIVSFKYLNYLAHGTQLNKLL